MTNKKVWRLKNGETKANWRGKEWRIKVVKAEEKWSLEECICCKY